MTVIVYVRLVPATTGSTDATLTSATSALALEVSVSVAVLLPGFGSVVPAGGVTVAVFVRSPVSELLGRAGHREDDGVARSGGDVDRRAEAVARAGGAAVTDALPVVVDVHVTPVRPAGIMSATVAPMTSEGPLLVTVMV